MLLLSTARETAPDIADIKFGEIKRGDCEVVFGKVHLETDATATVGFDRQEQYQEKVRKYDSETRRFYDSWETKTRTVTDWQAFSTHQAEDRFGAGINRDDRKNDPLRSCLFRNYRLQDMVKRAKELDTLQPMQSSTGDSKTDAHKSIPVAGYFGEEDLKNETRPYIKYPGDHQKDIREHSSKEVLFAECYVLPVYEVEFEYQGIKYRAVGFGFEGGSIEADIPPATERKDPTEIAYQNTRPLKIGFILSWIVCGIGVATQIAVAFFGIIWVGFLAIAAYVSAVALHIVRNLKYDRIVKAETADIAKTKQKALESSLLKRGYAQLNETEKERFQALTVVNSYKTADYNLSSPYVRAFIIGVALAFVLGIFMSVAS